MPEDGKAQAKEGGVLAGVAALIRELGEVASAAGGIVVVLVAIGAVVGITTTAMGTVPDGEKATVATAAFTVLGTIVGAYFGIRVGAKGKEQAEEERRVATVKVERLAASGNPQETAQILEQVDKEAAQAATSSPAPGGI